MHEMSVTPLQDLALASSDIDFVLMLPLNVAEPKKLLPKLASAFKTMINDNSIAPYVNFPRYYEKAFGKDTLRLNIMESRVDLGTRARND